MNLDGGIVNPNLNSNNEMQFAREKVHEMMYGKTTGSSTSSMLDSSVSPLEAAIRGGSFSKIAHSSSDIISSPYSTTPSVDRVD